MLPPSTLELRTVVRNTNSIRRSASGGYPMISMTIDGRKIAGTDTYGVVNPATGAVFASAPNCSQAELENAMAAASRAFRGWQREEGPRREALARAADIVSAH